MAATDYMFSPYLKLKIQNGWLAYAKIENGQYRFLLRQHNRGGSDQNRASVGYGTGQPCGYWRVFAVQRWYIFSVLVLGRRAEAEQSRWNDRSGAADNPLEIKENQNNIRNRAAKIVSTDIIYA